jgi:hypothetical protein
MRLDEKQMADDVVDPPKGWKPEDPPTGWMGRDDGSNQVAARARRSPVEGTTEFAVPRPLQGAAVVTGAGSLHADAQVAEATGVARARFDQQLWAQPAQIRDAARSLAQAVRDQIAELKEGRRNDIAEVIDFLDMVAGKLDELVAALDRAIEDAKGDQQPILLGRPREIAEELRTAFDKALPNIAQFSIRIGVVAAGALFLQYVCGFNPDFAALASILNDTFKNNK